MCNDKRVCCIDGSGGSKWSDGYMHFGRWRQFRNVKHLLNIPPFLHPNNFNQTNLKRVIFHLNYFNNIIILVKRRKNVITSEKYLLWWFGYHNQLLFSFHCLLLSFNVSNDVVVCGVQNVKWFIHNHHKKLIWCPYVFQIVLNSKLNLTWFQYIFHGTFWKSCILFHVTFNYNITAFNEGNCN